jgi:hypothetical protein
MPYSPIRSAGPDTDLEAGIGLAMIQEFVDRLQGRENECHRVLRPAGLLHFAYQSGTGGRVRPQTGA